MTRCVVGRRKGYSKRHDGRYQHRAAWEEAHGPIPEGLIIHHVCENPACVNVEHLRVVTRAEHVRIHRPRLKLTYEQVVEIRSSTESAPSLARRLEVGATQIKRIRRREQRLNA